jgi:uncharacterized membrane protein
MSVDDPVRDRATRLALAFLALVALCVAVVTAMLVYVNAPFGAVWIGMAAVVALLLAAAAQIVVGHMRRRAIP